MTPRAPRMGRMASLPAGLLAAIAIVVAGERAIDRGRLEYAGMIAFWDETAQAAEREAVGSDILFVGDSLVKLGLLPAVFDGHASMRSYNLGMASSAPPAGYFVVHRALSAGARPKAIVVGYSPFLLRESLSKQSNEWPELLRPAEAAGLAIDARDPEFLASTLAARWIPSLRMRPRLRKTVALALAGRRDGERHMIFPFARNTRVNRGAMAAPVNSLFRGDSTAEAAAAFSTNPAPLAIHRDYLRKLLRLATDRQIVLYWLIPPLSPAAQSRREAVGSDAEFSKLIAELQAEFPAMVVVDARRSGYRDDHFIDPIHLNHRGAARLTADFAAVVRDPSTGPGRWVDLPDPTGRDEPTPVEDLAASAEWLARAGRAQR